MNVIFLSKKTFTQSSSLAGHRKIHSGEKPFSCDICEKTFNQSSNLAKYKMFYTGEKPHECDFCKRLLVKNVTYLGIKRFIQSKSHFLLLI